MQQPAAGNGSNKLKLQVAVPHAVLFRLSEESSEVFPEAQSQPAVRGAHPKLDMFHLVGDGGGRLRGVGCGMERKQLTGAEGGG